MSIWYAVGGIIVFLTYVVVLAITDDALDVPFVRRHRKGLWNIAGALFFIATGISVVAMVSN